MALGRLPVLNHPVRHSEARDRIRVRKNSAGTVFGPRGRLNLIEGSGATLTVADDATNDEVDVTIAASGLGMALWTPRPISGREYYTTWGNNGTAAISLLAANIGDCYIHPIAITSGSSFDRIRVRVNNASNSTHRFGIYIMSTTTLLPTSLWWDAGTITWAGVGATNTIAIPGASQTITADLIGLGWFYESRTDAVNPSVNFQALANNANWPVGWDAASAFPTPTPMRIISTGNAAGAMPAVGTFVHSSTGALVTNTMPLIGLRVL